MKQHKTAISAGAPLLRTEIDDHRASASLNYLQGEKPLHEYLRQHAKERGSKPALVWYGRHISFAELDQYSDRFARALQDIGVGHGDRVALFLGNCPQYIIAHFGIQKLGAIVSPCSPMFKAEEFAYQVGDLGAKAIVTADYLMPVVRSVLDRVGVQHVFSVSAADFLPSAAEVDGPSEISTRRPTPAGTIDFDEVIKRETTPLPVIELSMDDIALMTYTSGSTGMPKGAMLTYRNALYKTAVAQEMFRVSGGDILLSVAPLYHIAGMICGLTLVIYTGATSVLLYQMDPIAALRAIEKHRVTWWYAMAPMLVSVMKEPGAEDYDLTSLRAAPSTSFGITLTEDLAERWRKFTKNCIVYEAGYGLSETHTVDTIMPPDAIRWGTNGILAPGVEARILDSEGNEVPCGESGEIALRSAGVFAGYWNRPDATAEVLRSGWVHTGDIGKIESDGYLTFLGRMKEMIKVSGYSVFPEEVESILILHPHVGQVAITGIPDAKKGEVVRAFIVLSPAARESNAFDPNKLIEWARENMAYYKVPREVKVLDALPATGTGKLLRRVLRDVP